MFSFKINQSSSIMIIVTIYNTVILVHSVIKFLDRKFLFIEKGLDFLN